VTALYENVYLKTKDPEEKKRTVDTMEYHINRSLEINPNYGSALVMKGAIAAARFEQDRQMDKLFHEFGILMESIPNNANFRPFFDKYMNYLATSGGNPNKINAFCYRIGYEYFFKQKNDLKNAVAILEQALPTQAENERLLNALSEVYTAAGNPQKAAEMKARAEASAKVIFR
jgi:tetratricopeptide (TPR) repeat protein